MRKRVIRVVIDTNWWISFVINSYKSQLTTVLLHPNIEIYSCEELAQEIFKTLDDANLQKYIQPSVKEEFIRLYPSVVNTIVVQSKVTACRDPKDNFLLALSKDAKALYLITGDKDLLSLNKFGKTAIVTMSEFLRIH
ncbi:MAG: putative toxin-antitoxin system toxin component, PIN family [Saprospiraceae bacterium]|nr:putative toxin-antitoxin system toxin component, PIN family [Saprospiraceae bacterium]